MDESVFIDPLICRKETRTKLNRKLLLFYTGIERISSTILEMQKATIDENYKLLDELVNLSEQMRKSIADNDITRFGELLHEGWEHKKKLTHNVSNNDINEYYEKARKAGAVGGKILGAGGGGFLLLFCEEDLQDNVRKALWNLKESPFLFEPQGSKIIYVSD